MFLFDVFGGSKVSHYRQPPGSWAEPQTLSGGHSHIFLYICVHIYTHIHMYVYIYIYT